MGLNCYFIISFYRHRNFGDVIGKVMTEQQPMKMAAAEALLQHY
jgi:cytochrome bd-type quinol oxidase subunit 1